MFGILAINFHIDIIAAALSFFGKVVIAANQVQRGTAYLSGYAYAVKFIVQCVTVVIVTIIAKSVILLFHIFPQSRQSLKPCQFITFKKEMANAPNMKPRVKYRTDIRG